MAAAALEISSAIRGMSTALPGKEVCPLKRLVRVFAVSLITLAGLGLVLAAYTVGLSDKNAAERDFISYWSAGQLIVHHKNPYDRSAVCALELAAGREPSVPTLIMRNPPVAFFLVVPLGFAGPKVSLILWLLVLLGALLLASFLIWRLHGKQDSLIHLLGFAFAPVLACLMAGQFGIFLMLGVLLFLSLYRNWPLPAGASLLLCALKPHFFVPFGVALVLWSIGNRRGYRIAAGFCAALAASCVFAVMVDPQAFAQYSQFASGGAALNDVVPTFGAQSRLLIDPRAVWIQFVPEALACLWTAWYFFTRRARWDWMDHGMVLLLVGAICTPYGFFTDEALLLPAVLAGLYRQLDSSGAVSPRRVWPLLVFAAVALAELMMNVTIVSPGYLWTTPAWLAWYLYATGRLSRRPLLIAA